MNSYQEPQKPPKAESLGAPLECELTWEYWENVLFIVMPFTALYMLIVPELSVRLFPTLKLQPAEKLNTFVSDCVSTIPSSLTGIITIFNFYYYVSIDDQVTHLTTFCPTFL